jgi:hypothetical protein
VKIKNLQLIQVGEQPDEVNPDSMKGIVDPKDRINEYHARVNEKRRRIHEK